MSGWDANPTPGSAWEGNTGSAGWISQQPDNATFNTSDMSAALPDDKVEQSQSDGTVDAAATSSGNATANGWVKPEEYDYGEYATGGGQFDCNAAVYYWDGEEGDIGPEVPELEADLFGPPERRELPHGIDFTK